MGWLMAAESGSGGSGYWQLALVLAGLGFLGFFSRWRKRRAAPPVDSRELRARDQDPNRYRDAADRAIVELLETSRALNAQVDTKIRMLNRLVKEAEEKTARLEALLARVEAADGAGFAAGPRDHPPAARRPEPIVEAPPAAEKGGQFHSELHERIFRLKAEGKTLAEIAKATSLSTTEVKFAIESAGL